MRDLWLRTGLPIATLQKLAEADAFTSMGLNRRDALWAVRGLIGSDGAETLPLFAAAGLPRPRQEAPANLPALSPGEAVVHDYRTLTLSLKAHPVKYVRPLLDKRGTLSSERLASARNGAIVEVAGLVLVRQRPGTASGVIFATLEDETGIANIIIWNKVFAANRSVVLGSRMLAVRGQVQREGLVIHVVARSFTDLTPYLVDLAQGHELPGPVVTGGVEPGDEVTRRQHDAARREARAALPGGRNFH